MDEKQPVKALTVVTAVTRTLRSVLTKKRPEILAIAQELKTKIEPDERPNLRIRPRYAPNECLVCAVLVQHDHIHDLHWCRIHVNWAIAQTMVGGKLSN